MNVPYVKRTEVLARCIQGLGRERSTVTQDLGFLACYFNRRVFPFNRLLGQKRGYRGILFDSVNHLWVVFLKTDFVSFVWYEIMFYMFSDCVQKQCDWSIKIFHPLTYFFCSDLYEWIKGSVCFKIKPSIISKYTNETTDCTYIERSKNFDF